MVVREPSTVSVAVAVNVTTTAAELVASVVISAGTVTTGAVVSTTVTVKVAVPVLSLLSVAEQVTVVSTSGKVLPDAEGTGGSEELIYCVSSSSSKRNYRFH